MKIKIESHFRDEEWEGEIPDQRPENPTELYLDFIFRYFNRVDAYDDERLERIGYHLPSLTAGDTVVLDNGERWFCQTIGWVRVPGTQSCRWADTPGHDPSRCRTCVRCGAGEGHEPGEAS